VQAHPNGAIGIASVVLVADDPSDHHVFLQAFAGVRDIRATSAGLVIPVASGQAIEVLSPLAFRHRFGVAVEGSLDLRARALVFRAPGSRRVESVRGLVLAFEGD
jgi:hypothetical protein